MFYRLLKFTIGAFSFYLFIFTQLIQLIQPLTIESLIKPYVHIKYNICKTGTLNTYPKLGLPFFCRSSKKHRTGVSIYEILSGWGSEKKLFGPLGPQRDQGTWFNREAGFTEWYFEQGKWLARDGGLSGRDSSKREQREIPGPVQFDWSKNSNFHLSCRDIP